MQLNKQEIVKRIDVGLKRYSDLKIPLDIYYKSRISHNEYLELHSLLSDLIDRYAPNNSSYAINLSTIFNNRKLDDDAQLWKDVHSLYGILSALRVAYDKNLLQSIEELIHGDVFQDFLEMAEYLLQDNSKDPAAMLIGCVLEEHLRKLCQKHNISIVKDDNSPKKASTLNDDLAGADIYNKGDQKSIVAWLDLRNNAVHGKFGEYQIEKVELTLLGLRDFISRYPA